MADSSFSPQPSPLFPTSSHAAMDRALDMSEISTFIRQDLQGTHLKSAVLVCRLWWRIFAPFLWERVFIDADPNQDDCEVLVRNGLAARSLTLSIYDAQDTKGVVAFVAEKCRNVEALHLKLFTPGLVTIDQEAKDRRLREMCASVVQGHGGDHSENYDDSDKARQFGIRSECKTELLDSLLSKLPWVSKLTLSIAHKDLRPEVLWSVPTLTRLRKLTVLGGLPSMEYILHKNRRCDWDLLLRVSRECKFLDSLSVSWEAHKLDKDSMDQHIFKMSEMFEALEPFSAREQKQLPPVVPMSEQCRSLRSLSVSSCELHDFQMDFFYRSCPNLRAVEFKAVQATPRVMEKNLESLAQSCPNLLTFKHLNTQRKGERIDYSKTLLEAPTSNIHSMTLSIAEYNSMSVFGNDPDKRDDESWTPPAALSTLTILDVRNASVILDAITRVPGLSQLTIDGYTANSPWTHSQLPELMNSHHLLERAYKAEKDPLSCLPTFANQVTLSYLDISTLDMEDSGELFKILFRRIQELKQLKYFKMSRDHVLAANLHLTWSDDTLAGDQNDPPAPATTITTTLSEPYLQDAVGEANENGDVTTQVETPHAYNPINASTDQDVENADDERVFYWFPTVEHLFLVEVDHYKRFHGGNPFLTSHQASALVRMMPRMKAMSFNREDAKIGLEGVIEMCSRISFNFFMRQK
ncbi:hypothetical protein BGZ95_006228 [Linnemannia exigua]|uniref:F-box domain-containing protein n=1 Tax=Linnemannia exigua TaxID=604196 RepID=A0AAD4DLE6_9FUNG|nr:hypothetical protein BGZ95_006228 [Linnemannia exigua]